MKTISMAKPSTPSQARAAYPQPKQVGGVIIRKVIAELKAAGTELPITSHILIATSGGSDSLALAHLLLKYGRRVAPLQNIALLHVDHGWRGRASASDARFVERFARQWGAEFILHRLAPPQGLKGESWEEVARTSRKAIYEQESAKRKAPVLTAHQADDLAETVLWRLLTGASQTHGGGIATQTGVELRPLLGVRKTQLQTYLAEEGQRWREDSTNHSGRFLRSKMRTEVMPSIERLFPKAVDHLVALARQAQAGGGQPTPEFQALATLFSAAGLRARRPHWQIIQKTLTEIHRPSAVMDLPNGWKLRSETGDSGKVGRWVLENPQELSGR